MLFTNLLYIENIKSTTNTKRLLHLKAEMENVGYVGYLWLCAQKCFFFKLNKMTDDSNKAE